MILSCSNICKSFGENDILKQVSFHIEDHEKAAIVGINGAGKSTLLKVLIGKLNADDGVVTWAKGASIGYLAQHQDLEGAETIYDALLEVKKPVIQMEARIRSLELEMKSASGDELETKLSEYSRLNHEFEMADGYSYQSEITGVLKGLGFTEDEFSKPITALSGGQKTRVSLGKLLLTKPDILLLDEPTKGLDAEFKQVFGQILRTLQASGVAILMVSHDIEFCAKYADRCALFFDGNIVTESEPKTFFSGNSFYTTAANRIARDILPEAVTPEDVIMACGGVLEPEPALPEYQRIPPAPEKEAQVLKKLPVWRKALAAVSGIVSLVLMIQAIGMTDLTKLVDAGGLTGLAGSQMRLYGILLLSLLVFALSIGRKADRPDYLIQTPVEKRKLRNRTIFATALILLLIPLTLFIGVYCFGGKRYYFISLLILLECMLPFFLIFEGRKPQARELVLIAVLVALNVAGRAAFFVLPEFKPVVAMTILAGVAFGGETGFLVGAMTMLVSNMLFSQGPWTPWQMFAMGIIGWLAGVLYRKGVLRRGRLSLCIFGVIASTIIYGGIMNPASALLWSNTINWKIILSYYVTGIPIDLVRALATFFFLWLTAEPLLQKLDRIKTKYGLAE